MRFVLIFILLFSFSFVSAIPVINLQNEEIQPEETVLGTISTVGEFTKEISSSDVKFFEGRREVFFEYDIKQYGGVYYFYVYANREGNFTIKVSDVLYKEAGELAGATIEKQIKIVERPVYYLEEINNSGNITTVNKSKTEILSIKPGLVFSSEIPKIKVTNKGNSVLNLTFKEEETTLETLMTTLQPLETREIIFTPNHPFSYFNVFSYKDFSIPIIYLGGNDSVNDSNDVLSLKFNLSLVPSNLIVGNDTNGKIRFFNFGDENITDIEITSSIDFVEIGELEDLKAGSAYNLSLTLSPKYSGHFAGEINITYVQYKKEKMLSIPLEFFVLSEGSNESDFIPSEKTCVEINGSICEINEECEGSSKFTKGRDFCCVGTCKTLLVNNNKGNYRGLVGFLIILGLGVAGYYLYNRSKKMKSKNPEEKIQESSEEYTKRISGGLQRS